MEQYKTITKQIGGVFLLQIAEFGLMFALFSILTRILSKSEFGIYSILNISILFATGLLGLGLHTFLLRDITGKKDSIKKDRFSSLFTFDLIFLFITIAFISTLSYFVLKVIRHEEFFLASIYILITSGLILCGSLINSYLKSNKKIVSATITDLLLRVLWAAPVIFFILLSKITITEIFLIRLIFTSLIFFIIIAFLKKKGLKFINKIKTSFIKKAIIFGLPLSTLTISDWIITASDRYMLGLFQGSIHVANYSYIYSLLNFILIFFIATQNVTIYPYVVEAHNKKDKEKRNFLFNSHIKYTLVMALPVLAGFFILSEELVIMISGTKYINAISIIPFLILFPLLDMGSRIYNKTLLLENKTKTIAAIYITGMVINIILNFILIPRYSYYGAAIATTISYIVLFGLFYFKGHKYIKIDHSYIKIPKIVFSTIIMSLSIAFIHPQNMFTKLLTIGFGAGIYFLCLFITKAYVKEEFELIKSFLPRIRK